MCVKFETLHYVSVDLTLKNVLCNMSDFTGNHEQYIGSDLTNYLGHAYSLVGAITWFACTIHAV